MEPGVGQENDIIRIPATRLNVILLLVLVYIVVISISKFNAHVIDDRIDKIPILCKPRPRTVNTPDDKRRDANGYLNVCFCFLRPEPTILSHIEPPSARGVPIRFVNTSPKTHIHKNAGWPVMCECVKTFRRAPKVWDLLSISGSFDPNGRYN